MAAKVYSIGDIRTIRENLYSNLYKEISDNFKVEDDNYLLTVKDLQLEEKPITPQKEKEALLTGQTLFQPIRGNITLIDKTTGKPISSQRKRIAIAPYITPRGTFIVNGVEYGLINQLRLRPGIYTRLTNTGEYEALVNVAGAPGHRYVLDPESGVFYLTTGQAKIPLLPILRSLGISDSEIAKAWGKDIYLKNAEIADPKAVERAYTALFYKQQSAQPGDAQSRIKAYFQNLKFDPTVNSITIGMAADKFSPQVILRTTQKLLNSARGEENIDDRNHIAFLKMVGPEDLFREYIRRETKSLQKYFNRVRARRSVDYFPTGVFDQAIKEAIYGSGLGNALQEINPIEILDNRFRVTRLGEGGISSIEQVADDVRYLHPSHLGYIDPIVTPEGTNVGVDNRLTLYSKRDAEGNIYSPFYNPVTKKIEYLTPQKLFNKVITFPGELESGKSYVRAIINNQHVIVSPRHVDYVVPTPEHLYSGLSNLIPFKQNAYPQRVSMGARMITQAVPLREAEAPLVRNLSHEHGRSYDEVLGEEIGTRRSPISGTVTRVGKEFIIIRGEDGQDYKIPYYKDHPYNRKTFYTETPIVKAGDKIKVGQILARSNYVDPKDNALALGKNLRTAYLAWEGYNFEDAAVLSESAAKKLVSEHMYQHWKDLTPNMYLNKAKFMAIFPGKYKKDFYERYNEDGVIKPGTVINKGEPLALIATAVPVSKGERNLYQDSSIIWESEDPAEVVSVAYSPKHINVILKATHPLKVGDKIAGRYGDKHIIAAIVPDDQMPKDSNNQPFELLLNPLGVVGRANISQIYELLLSNVVRKTGKPVVIPDHEVDSVELAKKLLEEHQISDKEKVLLEKYGKVIETPAGYRYMMKLHHMAESKLSGRGTGSYSSEETPVKGGFSGAKRIGTLEMLGILSHGAYNVARDARVVRGQKNEEYWTRVKLGYDIPKLNDTPFIYDKFLAQLTAMGLNPNKRGEAISIYALRDKDIDELASNRYLENGDAVEYRGGKLVVKPGGLFDPKLTGGMEGKFWTAIKLAEPMPNPMFEVPIRTLLGLTEKEFLDVISGRKELGNFGTGTKALAAALSSIDIDKELKNLESTADDLKGAKLDAVVKKIKLLRALKENNVKPHELIWTKFPVVPPAFRPVGVLATTGIPLVSDVNYLYKDLFELNKSLEELKKHNIDDPNDRLLVYNAMKAIVGLHEPVHPKYRAQNVKGLLQKVIGSSPKEGVVQKKLLGAQVDLVGRGTIIPNPNLDLDEVAIPEESAWEVYKPFIIRRLIKGGMPATAAFDSVEKRSDAARNALVSEMSSRPVLISRAPVLHKYGIMAAWPKLTKNTTIEIHPFLVSGFGADFDGDAMQFHVPVDPAAVKEAIEKMLPSKNLLSFQRFQAHMVPTMEYAAGLYHFSTLKLKKGVQPVRFKTRKELIEALRSGKISPDDPVILESDK